MRKILLSSLSLIVLGMPTVVRADMMEKSGVEPLFIPTVETIASPATSVNINIENVIVRPLTAVLPYRPIVAIKIVNPAARISDRPSLLPTLMRYVREYIPAQKMQTLNPEEDPGRRLFENNDKPVSDVDLTSGEITPDAVRGPSNLEKEFTEALLNYHRVDGRKDGSPLEGEQYPPVPGIEQDDTAGLKKYISGLARFLGAQFDIHFRPAPKDPEGRAAYRKQWAKDEAQTIRAHAFEEFTAVVEGIQNSKVKVFVKAALKQAQPEFWRAPSSSTGKYHPADEINYGGLLVHSVRNVIVGRMLSHYFNLAPERYDFITAALLLHDIDKGGSPWKHTNHPGDAPDSGYVTDHGPVAAEWLKTFEDECGSDCDAIIEEVRDHMAQWNKPGPTPPDNLEKQIVSYADYLASQDRVDVQWRGTPGKSAP